VAAVTSSPRRMVVLAATERFRRYQLGRMPRAGSFGRDLSDPELALRNKMERDRIVVDHAVRNARRLNIRVIEVDGTRDADAMADLVAEHFGEFLF
jgi:hypothetical protein